MANTREKVCPYLPWIIYGSRLLDCHAPLATTMLFKIYVDGCEAQVYGCGSPPQIPCNEADAVKSARPKSKLCRHIIKRNTFETD